MCVLFRTIEIYVRASLFSLNSVDIKEHCYYTLTNANSNLKKLNMNRNGSPTISHPKGTNGDISHQEHAGNVKSPIKIQSMIYTR